MKHAGQEVWDLIHVMGKNEEERGRDLEKTWIVFAQQLESSLMSVANLWYLGQWYD